MAARAAADLHPDVAFGEVEVVVDDDQVFSSEPDQRRPRVVHERRRLQECDLLDARVDGCRLGLLSLAPGAAVAAGQLVDDEEADVVEGTLEGAPRVTEADYHGGPLTRSPAVFLPPEPVEKGAYGLLFLDVLARAALASSGRLLALGALFGDFLALDGLALLGLLLDDAGGLEVLLGDLRRHGDGGGDLLGVRRSG